MTAVSATKTVRAPRSEVWAVLKDFQAGDKFHPLVESVDPVGDVAEGLHAGRRCNFYDGTSVVEKVTQWEDQRSFRVELSEFSMPLKSAASEMRLESIDADHTRVEIEMEMEVKWGFLGKIMGSVMMKPMMTKVFKQVLAGLEHHVRTGEFIGKDGKSQATGVAAV